MATDFEKKNNILGFPFSHPVDQCWYFAHPAYGLPTMTKFGRNNIVILHKERRKEGEKGRKGRRERRGGKEQKVLDIFGNMRLVPLKMTSI